MGAIKVTNAEIKELKSTMGFRITKEKWNDFVESHPDGCDSDEMIAYVKQWMDPPYPVANVDDYLNGVMVIFVNFIRS